MLEADDGSLEMPRGTPARLYRAGSAGRRCHAFETVLAADTERAALMIESEQRGLRSRTGWPKCTNG
jgi:ATP-binding cassette subfamily F protein 3